MKRMITGTVEGTITEEMNQEYHRILADAIVKQYGASVVKELIKRLEAEKEESCICLK